MVAQIAASATRAPLASEKATARSVAARKKGRNVAAAAQGKKAPLEGAPPVVIKALGLLAAAQLAIGGPAFADVESVLPDTSAAARAAVNKETSEAPSFSDIGNSLSKQFNTNDPQEVGRAIDRATPDVDLTKNPKALADEAGKKVSEAVSNISELLPGPNPFGKGNEGLIPRLADREELAKRAAKTAASDVGGKVEKVADKAQKLGEEASKIGPDAPTANEAVGQLSSTGQQDDLFNNPLNPFEMEVDKFKTERAPVKAMEGKIDALDAKLDPQSGSSPVGKVGSAAAEKGQQAREALRNVRAAGGDLALSNPFASGPEKAGQEAQSAAKDVARDAGKVANKVPGPSELGDAAKAKAKEAGRAVQQVTGNVSLSNPFASGPEKAGQEAQSAAKDVARDAGKVANKVPGPSELGDAAKAKAKEAGRAVQQVTGNVSFGIGIPDELKGAPATQKGPSVTTKSEGLGRPLDVKDAEREQSAFPSPTELQKIDRTEAQAAAEKYGAGAAGNLPSPQEIGKSLPSASDVKLPSLSLPKLDLPSPGQAAQKVSELTQ